MTTPPAPSPWFRDLRVGERAAGRRLDAYLADRFPDWSRTELARQIRAGSIRSEDRPLKPSSRLRLGERILLQVAGLAPTEGPPPLPPVLYEDDRLLVLDKPPGLLCHPAGDRWAWAVIGLARRAYPKAAIDLTHRLDRDTSGVLVLTKDMQTNAFMKQVIHDRRVHKRYLALVRGHPSWETLDIQAPIDTALGSEIRLKQGVVPDGRPARTTARRLALVEHADLALVELILHTGRTHQIRVHMEHVGHPLLGDRIYGQPEEIFLHSLAHGEDARVRAAVGFPRQALHCAAMSFPHPDRGSLTVTAPLAADLQAILDGAPPCWPDPPEPPPC